MCEVVWRRSGDRASQRLEEVGDQVSGKRERISGSRDRSAFIRRDMAWRDSNPDGRAGTSS